MNSLPSSVARLWKGRRKEILRAVECIQAERSLSQFIRMAWPVVEPATYVHGRHIDVIADHLEAVSSGQIKRLIINIPPRHTKSLTVSVLWPAWTWIGNPGRRWLFSSYAGNLSIRDNVKCRDVVRSPWFQERWGDKVNLKTDQSTKQKFETTAGGYRIATSVDGQLTGEGGDIVVVDDPHNVREAESDAQRKAVTDWWDGAMRTRLNDPVTGAFVVIMQRVHEADLTGHILASETGWDHLCLPAVMEADHPHPVRSSLGWVDNRAVGDLLWPERFPRETIDQLFTGGIEGYHGAGQLQQRPAPRAGGMFKRDDFRIIKDAPECSAWVRRWDLGATIDGDPSAGVLMGRRKDGLGVVIADIQRFRKTPGGVKAQIKAAAKADEGARIVLPQDPGQAGVAQKNDYAAELEGLNRPSFIGDRLV